MPSYRQLRDVYHVAQNTAQAAVRLLAAEGLVEIRPSRGAFVRENIDIGEGWDLRAELTSVHAALQRSRQDLAAAEDTVAGLLARHFTEENAD
jgi:DNA-binding FadR family transcriptional regulator